MTKPLNSDTTTWCCMCLGCTFPDGEASVALRIADSDDDAAMVADDLSINSSRH